MAWPSESAKKLIEELDDQTLLVGDAPPLRSAQTGKILATAARERAALAVETTVPYPLCFPARGGGGMLGGVFSSMFSGPNIRWGGPPCGFCSRQINLYKPILEILMVVNDYNAHLVSAATRDGAKPSKEYGQRLLSVIRRLSRIDPSAMETLREIDAVWATQGFKNYLAALWDDFYADSACLGGVEDKNFFADGRLAVCAQAVASYRAVEAPFPRTSNAAPRFCAAVLTWLLRSGRPITAKAGSGGRITSGENRVYADNLEVVANFLKEEGWIEPFVKQAKVKISAIRGPRSQTTLVPPAQFIEEAVDAVILARPPGAQMTGIELFTKPWPEWMVKLADG